MPYKFDTDKLKIQRCDDKRVKLSLEQREEIKELYGKISQRKLAKMYDVSRRLIIFIGCPEKQERNLQQRKESGGSSQYHDTEKQRLYMRTHRENKQELMLKGRLI